MSGRVLLIDDEEDLLSLLKDFFELEGLDVLTALSGREALELLDQHDDIAVIISDKNLTDMTGNDILNKLKEGGDYPPFFFSTGAVEYSEEQAIADGATGLFAKPFELEQVIETVKKFVEKS